MNRQGPWGSLFDSLKNAALELLFPPRCAGCGKVGHWLCPDCLQKLRPPSPGCLICGKPGYEGRLCPACSRRNHSLEAVITVARFESPLREAIHRLKYSGQEALAAALAGLMACRWRESAFSVDVIIPVPLHPRRFRERGFNQAAVLACCLGSLLRLPVLERALVRTRYTRPQVGLGVEERAANVKGAFSCSGGQVWGKDVLLIDDVCTTGATLEACGAALKAAGARKIYGLTLARAPLRLWDAQKTSRR